MLRRACQLFAAAASALLLLATMSASAFAEEAQRWAVNMPKGVTPVSREIYDIHMIIFWLCVVIGVIVFGVMFYSMIAHRKSKGAVASNFHENTTAEIVWTLIPALILIVMAFPATKSLLKVYDTSEAEMTVKVTGYQWKWQYEYLGEGVTFLSELATPESVIYDSKAARNHPNYLQEVSQPLVIPARTKVRFLLTAKDVIHSWWVIDLGVKKDAIPGFINETWAYVEETGIYRGECAELCGKGHAFMPVVVKVVEPEEYATWIAAKKEAATAERELANKVFSVDELMTRGEDAYNRSCAACHMANGEGIPGVFPALKDSSVALGDVAKHMDVVVNGVAGTAMQSFGGQLSEVDLAAIITFERNAWGNDKGDFVQPIDVLKFKQGQ